MLSILMKLPAASGRGIQKITIKKIERSDTTSFHYSFFTIQFGPDFARLGHMPKKKSIPKITTLDKKRYFWVPMINFLFKPACA